MKKRVLCLIISIILTFFILIFLFIPWTIEYKSSYDFETDYSGPVYIIPSISQENIINNKIFSNLTYIKFGEKYCLHFNIIPKSDEIKSINLNTISILIKDEKIDLSEYLESIYSSNIGYIETPKMNFEKGENGFNYYMLNYSKIALNDKFYELKVNLSVQTDEKIDNLVITYKLKRKRNLKIYFMTV